MNFSEYQQQFDRILNEQNPQPPYDDEHYLEYTKLNASRQHRWLKKGILTPETISTIQSISEKQHWILITEHWCGDAAHNVPFIYLMAELNPNITLELQLRDSEGSEIDSYLTNGGKSIPKLIIRDTQGNDLHVWGPRPQACQVLFDELKQQNKTFEDQKIALQKWYNEDKGITLQEEICDLLNNNK
jgi:hypothetical protein